MTCTRTMSSCWTRSRAWSPALYRKLHVRVATLDGEVTAWVYVFAGYEGGLPTAWYLSEIADAARKAGAPDDYVEELRARPTRTATA